jgi:hypothetical protein
MRRRWIRALLPLLLCSHAKADPVNLTCTTDPLSTSIAVFTAGTDVTVRVIHAFGTDYMPLSHATITPHDLPALQQKAADLARLGAQYDIHIDSSQCKIDGQKLVSCAGGIDQTVNGRHLTYLFLGTSNTTTVSPLYPDPFQQTWVDVSITMDGKDYDFGMDYPPSGCASTSGSSGT